MRGEGLQAFDWLGAILLGGALVFGIFFLSSRTVTGVEPLRDWRLLAAAVGLGLLFWRREGRTPRPLVNFSLYRRKNFGVASLAAGFRMVIMHTAMFLNVLFLTDVYGLDAIELGIFTTIFSGAIFATTQVGGQLADRMHGRWIVGGSFAVMICTLAGLALLPLPLLGAAAMMLTQSLAGGLAMAALHRAAMEEIPMEESGSAAGLYSTARFGGGVVGATIAGVGLQQALLVAPGPLAAYQWVFGGVAVISLASLAVAWRLER
ncbi:MAG: MFS transporter [Caldilineaceae bacterium SB0665_bin_25]|nr:MFS transporter [Caldilineaceae bacterium SB0665_bin_25]